MSGRKRGFELRLLVFLLSALWGLAAAYDTTTAAAKFAFISGGLLLTYCLARLPSHLAWRGRDISLLRIVVSGTPTLIATYFLATHDWAQPVDKVPWLNPLQDGLATARATLPLPALHPNVVGGLLAMLLPLQVAALLIISPRAGPSASLRATTGGIALIVLSLTALLATRLRGAWAALAIAGACWLICRLYFCVPRHHRKAKLVVLAGSVILSILLGMAWAPVLAAARPDRIFVWSNSWHLAWDYAFTGLGLGSVTMPYSSYAVLLHVPHTTHAHNLFLDLWLEHGVIGLLAFLWIVAGAAGPRVLAAWQTGDGPPRPHARWWHTAALISLLVVLLHGLIDDPYYGYGGAGALLLFVPVALLSRRSRSAPPRRLRRTTRTPVLWVATGIAVILLLTLPETRALYHANLGALSQTRAELAIYQWPAWAVQDEVRRSTAIDLTTAVDHYRTALSLNPSNPVANRRLGQIALSLGEYEQARAHFEAAHRVSPAHYATRQMYGESLALSGDTATAAALWRTMPPAEDQLAIRAEWYRSTGDSVRAGWVREAIERVREE